MIRKTITLIFIVLLGFTACKNTKNVLVGEGEGDQVILFEQKGCVNMRCATYELELLDNKQMNLFAIANMDKEGHFTRLLSVEEYKHLINAFTALNYNDYETQYAPLSNIDRESVLSIKLPKHKATIKNGGSAPDAIKELELIMKSYLDRVGWEPVAE